MILKDSEGLEITCDVAGEEPDDIHLENATYIKTGEAVSDDVLEWLFETYGHEIDAEWFQNKIDEAEHLNDIEQDR